MRDFFGTFSKPKPKIIKIRYDPASDSVSHKTQLLRHQAFFSSSRATTFETFLTSSSENAELSHQISIRSHILQWVSYENCQISFNYFNQFYSIKDRSSLDGNSSSHVIHSYCFCDWCSENGKQNEISGNRYHCLQCQNFDSCQECFTSHQDAVCGIDGHTYCVYSVPRLVQTQLVSSNYSDTLCNILLYYDVLPCLGLIDPAITCEEYQYQWMSYQEIYQICLKLGSYLRHLNTGPQDMVLICATNSREYMISDLTCGIYGFIFVPFSSHISFVDFEEIYNQLMRSSQRCQTLILSEDTLEKYLPFIEDKLPSIRQIILLSSLEIIPETSIQITTLQSILTSSIPFLYPHSVSSSAIVTLSFTSGTSTGVPKGLPITCEQRLKQLVYYCHQAELSRVPKEISLIFTNLNYTASREEILFLMIAGGQAGIYPSGRLQSSSPSLYRHIEIIQPTFFAAVPSFWCELYNTYQSEFQQLSSSEGNGSQSTDVLHSKYYQIFGNRCVSISTGSAHTPTHVYQFMKTILTHPPASELRTCISIPRLIYEGYGTMECGGISNNGKFLDSVLWKVSTGDVDDDDEQVISTFNGRTLRGELYIHSSRMISEYYQNTELTCDRYTSDGFFKTGDLVELTCHCGCGSQSDINRSGDEKKEFDPQCCCDKLGGPHVSVIGRIGATIKLRNGEYFSPEVIEGILLKCPSILDIFVHLEMKYGYSVAVVIHSSDLSHLSSDDLEQMILEEIQCISDKEMISKPFLPQSFVFTSVPFTMESNQITSSGKKCRSKILESYRQEIDRCYQRIETRNHMSSLVDIFQQMFHHEAHVTSSTNFWKHGLDSLGIASVVQQIHSKQLFKEIPNDLCKQYLMQSQDIESFVKNLEQSSGHSHLSSLTLEQKEDAHANMKSFSLEEDWKVTAVNDLNWECHSHLLRIPKTLPPDGHMHIFLLGFTGFIGSTIFATLMNLKIDSLTILIRSNRSTKTTTRGVFQRFIVTLLSLSLPQWSTEEEILNSFSSVTIASSIHCRAISRHQQEAVEKSLKPDLFILEGDLSEPNFFLCDQQYEDLLRRTTHCINASGQSSFLSSYFQMRSSNVCTTKQLIQFLTQSTHLIRLIFISSLSASFQPTLPSFHFYELDLPSFNQLITQSIHSCSVEGSLSIGYPLSKMIAEYLISFHCQRDQIPYISLQLGTVSSQSETGFSNLTDFTTRLIHSLVSHNTSPILNQSTCFGSIDLLSVDFVSRVVELFVTKDDLYHNKIMPLYTSVPTPFYDLITGTLTHLSLTDPSASERELISLQDWINQLTPADPLFPLSTVVTDILLSPNPLLRSQSATTEKRKFQILYLSPSEEICVPFEEFDVEKMIPRIVNWILRSSHEKRCLSLLETED